VKLIRKARGNEIQRQQQRVFLCQIPENEGGRNPIVDDLLSMDAGMDCVVSWLEDRENALRQARATTGLHVVELDDEVVLRNELIETQAMVLWVTEALLQSIATKHWPKAYLMAQELRVPILPIASDGNLFPRFTELAGAIHGLATTDTEYRTKLKVQMETFLASDETVKQIQEKAFTSTIFLSYRKKDIEAARRFMKAFHDLAGFESVSIWYDSFLTAGRNFDYEIEESVLKSDAFVLLVTPNLLTKGNYVQTTEYPFARDKGKTIIPVEAVSSNTRTLKKLFRGAGSSVSADNAEALQSVFQDKFSKMQTDMHSEQAYLLGMAYLRGFGVEKDVGRAIKLFSLATDDYSEAAWRAACQLSVIYESGYYLPHVDSEKVLHWKKRVCEICERFYGVEHDNTETAYNNMGYFYSHCGEPSLAIEWYQKALVLSEKIHGVDHRSTAICYDNLGTAYCSLKDSKALAYHTKAFEIFEKLYGINHIDCIQACGGIGSSYLLLEDWEKALLWFHKALSASESTVGTGHPQTAGIYNQIGACYIKKGDFKKGFENHLIALKIKENAYKNIQTSDTALSCNNVAFCYENLGEYDQAVQYYQRAMEIYSLVFGYTSEKSDTLHDSVIRMYTLKGDMEKVFDLLYIHWMTFCMTVGSDHHSAITAFRKLGFLLAREGIVNRADIEHWNNAKLNDSKVKAAILNNVAKINNTAQF